MNSNFNRQFIMTDFRLLENREFLKFIGSSEYATYLVLRKYVWRGTDPHFMGLNELYVNDKVLVSSIEREKVAEITGVSVHNISRHLSSLESKGIIRIKKTGRQNIYTLGEWIDVNGDGSYRGVEWFYLDGNFGISKSEVSVSDTPDVPKMAHQTVRSATLQTVPIAAPQKVRSAAPNNIYNNKQENREYKTITNGDKNKTKEINLLTKLPKLNQPKEKTEYVVDFILDEINSPQSRKFYEIVAAKVPEDYIRRAISEIKTDGAKSPEKVFTYRMMKYALDKNTATI